MTGSPRPTPRLRSTARWFDVRGRAPGTWAYALSRATGLLLVGYLYVHLAVLSLLARGPGSYDRFVDLMRSPLFLLLDVGLIAALLIHALNGLRQTVVGLGVGARAQHTMLVAGGAVAVVVLVAATVLLFGG